MDARFNGVGPFMNISACMATDIWTETEVLKEMEDQMKTDPFTECDGKGDISGTTPEAAICL